MVGALQRLDVIAETNQVTDQVEGESFVIRQEGVCTGDQRMEVTHKGNLQLHPKGILGG